MAEPPSGIDWKSWRPWLVAIIVTALTALAAILSGSWRAATIIGLLVMVGVSVALLVWSFQPTQALWGNLRMTWVKARADHTAVWTWRANVAGTFQHPRVHETFLAFHLWAPERARQRWREREPYCVIESDDQSERLTTRPIPLTHTSMLGDWDASFRGFGVTEGIEIPDGRYVATWWLGDAMLNRTTFIWEWGHVTDVPSSRLKVRLLRLGRLRRWFQHGGVRRWG